MVEDVVRNHRSDKLKKTKNKDEDEAMYELLYKLASELVGSPQTLRDTVINGDAWVPSLYLSIYCIQTSLPCFLVTNCVSSARFIAERVA